MIRAILTDIEGTTSSISFVVDVLFPYAKEHLPTYLREHAQDPVVLAEVDEVRRIVQRPDASLDDVTGILLSWIAEDRKLTPLKTLQGLVWTQGYADGSLQGHVYDDVPDMLRHWREQGLTLAVYSSGSVAAQKLIFGHTLYGDLTALFSSFFDTTTGGKREAASYSAIAASLGLSPDQILFLSDIRQELDAARQAGLKTCGLERGDRGVTGDHHAVTSFPEIHPDALE